ncbi:hypothetical protein [Phycicoccus sp. HDW14]|uniref:hypothetical protein n=1 Tax=Phycicoccus sp. HDW14 TaxID=2714941 RepID=UPI001F113CDD|nr:hypothetical protein [Phycicoccus sp. HDW14]
MTDYTLAQLSNYSVYSSMVVLTLAMLAHGLYLARVVPAREAVPSASSWGLGRGRGTGCR